jgi:hypothetical protein
MPAVGTVMTPRGSNCRADLGGRPVAVVRLRLDQDGHPAGAVPLVDDLLVLVRLAGTRGALDRPLDRIRRHVHRAGLLDRQAKPEVAVGIRPAGPGGDRDLAAHLREDRAPLDVVGALLALDLRPLGMT